MGKMKELVSKINEIIEEEHLTEEEKFELFSEIFSLVSFIVFTSGS